ncbi:hypothetical protein GWI33_016897 [Rhynchophorus ferrugineus]|uniref:Uncharacterized protein n=1 Tax=Rhynchophorus ferrugineus TaxID=354439 RepID=A0A834I0X4_RHYFE|nr:hypothetical protein GWI33_016897 [Rhynchophorus ferrugineus]
MPPTSHNATPATLGSTNGTMDTKSDTKNGEDTTELDPCLDQKAPIKDHDRFYDKYLDTMEKKTGLTRKWVWIMLGLVLALLVLLVLVVALGVTWNGIPHMYKYPICKDPGCLRAAAQIKEDLDTSVSPCSNLWGAFCSSWSRNSTRPTDRAVWNQKEKLVVKESERIRTLISTLDLPLATSSIEWKLKYLYQSCVEPGVLYRDNAWPLTNIITELGGWYITKNWNRDEFNGIELLSKLQVSYGVSPFFRIHVEPDPHSPDSYSVRISPSGLGLPDRLYYYLESAEPMRNAYLEYIRDVVINLNTPKSEASKFAQDIYSYEKRIAEVTPSRASSRNPITSYNTMALFELKDAHSMIPFHDILQAMYPKANISENTEVIITSLSYLTQISQIIASTDRLTMNGYLIWSLVQKYIPFLADQYPPLLHSFNSALFGISQPLKRWEFCTSLLKTHMGLAIEYLHEKASPINTKTKNIVNSTFHNILGVVKEKIAVFKIYPLLYQHLDTKLNSITLQVGLPEDLKTLQYLKDYFVSFTVIKLNFFESVKNAMIFRTSLEEKLLTKSLTGGDFLAEYLRETPAVRYVASKNQVIVPRSLLSEPFFSEAFPASVLYGRIGQEIAESLITSILPYHSLWTSDKKILTPFHMTVNESFRSVTNSRRCLSRYLSRLDLDVPMQVRNETALSIIQELSALSITSEALSRMFNDQNHKHQGGLEQYEEQGLLFISYAQTRCSEQTSQQRFYQNIVDFTLSQKTLLHIAWSQVSVFQGAFSCKEDKDVRCPSVF